MEYYDYQANPAPSKKVISKAAEGSHVGYSGGCALNSSLEADSACNNFCEQATRKVDL